MKTLHPYQLCLIGAGLLIIAFTIVLSGCGSLKMVAKTQTQSHVVTKVDSNAVADKITKSQFFGDTLAGGVFVPQDTAQSNSFKVESSGIVFMATLSPKRNAAGTVIGNTINYQAIAKPIAQTTVTDHAQTGVVKNMVVDAKAVIQQTTTKKIGLTLNWWWAAIIFGLLIVAAGLFINRLKKL